MTSNTSSADIESALKLWRDAILRNHKRKELSPNELALMFHKPVIILIEELLNIKTLSLFNI
jgi:hypothetical protein